MSMKLMVLGLLMENPQHPYEIRQTMKKRNWNASFRLQDGSLYYAVDQLRESGCIEAVEAAPGQPRRDRTIYRITDKGRGVLRELMQEQMEKEAYPQHPMMMAMPFLRHAEPSVVADVASRQLDACRRRIARLEEALELRGRKMPTGSVRMIEGMIGYGRAEEKWLADVLEDARAGRLDPSPLRVDRTEELERGRD
ncbi:PadR family transcriptional regulator [Cohnella fermenti]|uniref:Helix-turn-helix transcriptional regulator n=1 Tax=Cohnella fermenti TaxID=2565925 RepID=A0A4S4BPU5_9BACL|nr:PadR family transcriptional regulator [Cohnella fermenti]THF76907.1 helix-turn-helix transcriptional regulator [Cohnella fermenti]